MIGLIVALKSEVSIVNSFIKDIKPHTVDGYKCYVITLLGKQLVLIYSGVGKVNAAIATYILINHFSVDLIINAGLCGYLKDTENEIGTFFIPRFVTYFDVDATIFDYEINQLPHENAKYEIDNELINNLYRWIESYGHKLLIGTIASGDSFVSKKNIHKFNLSNNIDVVDMESCAIAQVCHNMKIKYGFIKLVSDIVKKDESQSKQWENATKNSNTKLTETLINVCYQIIYSQIN